MGSREAELRRRRRRSENRDRSQPLTTVGTIGERQNNGLYTVTVLDGGEFQGKGVKVFNAQTEPGDPVTIIPRRDGTLVLEGPNGIRESEDDDNPRLPALRDRCESYLRGKIFDCAQELQEELSIWGLTRFETNFDWFFRLANLETGQDYALVGVPKEIRPCPTNPPNLPPAPPPPPPTDPNGVWYLHIWTFTDWGFVGQQCTRAAPTPPNNDGDAPTIFTNDLLASDGREWFFEDSRGFLTGGGSWLSQALWTWSQDATPPTTPAQGERIIATGNVPQWDTVGFFDVSNTAWTYSAGGCPTFEDGPDPARPPRDQNINNPDIPNTVEYSISTDELGNPIVFIRHSPSCQNNTWDFERSFILNNGAIRGINGKLTTDWRYTETDIPDCRDTWASDNFANLIPGEIWRILPDDRPANLAPVTAFDSTVTAGFTDAANCGTPVGNGEEAVSIRQNNAATVEVLGIAAIITE